MSRMSWQEDVLVLLGGRSLNEFIPKEIQSKISDITKELDNDELLHNVQSRSHLIVLLTRLKELSNSELTGCLDVCFTKLRLPELEWIWWIDEYTITKPEYNTQLIFKQESKNYMILIDEILKLGRSNKSDSIDQISTICSFSLIAPWSDVETVALYNRIISHYEINDEVLNGLSRIVSNSFKDFHNGKITTKGYKRAYQVLKLAPALGFQINDPRYIWKTQKINSLGIFNAILNNLNTKSVKDFWWLITPTILNVLDDHEGAIKLKGVELLSKLLTIVDGEYLQQSGVSTIYHDALIPLLSYLPKLTPTNLSCLILKQTYPTLIELFRKSSIDYTKDLIGLMNSGIFNSINSIRDNFEVLIILIDQLILIIKELKLQTLKTLPRLLYILGMIISDPFIDTSEELFSKALDCLITIELNCWPRLLNHRYDILGMIIMSYNREKKSKNVNSKIQTSLQILRNVLDDEILQNDIDELIQNDITLAKLFK